MKLYAVISKAPDGGIVVVGGPAGPMPLFCLKKELSVNLVGIAQQAAANSNDPELDYGIDLVEFEAVNRSPIEITTKAKGETNAKH